MEKSDQARGLTVITEIKKERVPVYPFYILTDSFTIQNRHLLFVVDYFTDGPSIYIYSFDNKFERICNPIIMNLADTIPKKYISLIEVKEVKIKNYQKTFALESVVMVIGYRTGQLVVIQFKDRDVKTLMRFNKAIQKEGFFTKLNSSIFGADQAYVPFVKNAVKMHKSHSQISKFNFQFKFSYQVGNVVLFNKGYNQKNQIKLFNSFLNDFGLQQLSAKQKQSINKRTDYDVEVNSSFKIISQKNKEIIAINFKNQICTYDIIFFQEKLVFIVAYTQISKIQLFNFNSMTYLFSIQMSVPIRKINSYLYEGMHYFSIMPYENYLIIYNLNHRKYCKYIGNRSYVSNTIPLKKSPQKIVVCGMDNRITIINQSKIKKDDWIRLDMKNLVVSLQQDKIEGTTYDVTFYSQYTNRNNLQSYGLADSFYLNNEIAFNTYDGRVKIVSIK